MWLRWWLSVSIQCWSTVIVIWSCSSIVDIRHENCLVLASRCLWCQIEFLRATKGLGPRRILRFEILQESRDFFTMIVVFLQLVLFRNTVQCVFLRFHRRKLLITTVWNSCGSGLPVDCHGLIVLRGCFRWTVGEQRGLALAHASHFIRLFILFFLLFFTFGLLLVSI